MTFFDENHSNGGDGAPEPAELPSVHASVEPAAPLFADAPIGDPFSYGATHPQPYALAAAPKSDLEVPWSWGHLLLFILFGVVSFVLVQSAFITYYILTKRLSTHPAQKEFQQFAYSTPFFAVGSMVVWYALLFLFFFITLSSYYHAPFWESLGWRRLNPENRKVPRSGWIYFLLGCGMSFVVMAVTATVKAPEHAPIQDMLKNRTMAFAFMGMAVLVAPLVEETLFRGYLYPVFTRIISAILRFCGMAASQATNTGVFSSIVLTGVLFGLMHGYQLGWSKAIVAALIGVGIVLTIVRSRAETTLASFLMHLGYNSVIAFLGTIGLIFAKYAKLPPPHP
ncbi:MAG TPA: CPBP family intramembrane glutamic endopeptidase [Candidatus Sulfotelmatobacter sp.]|jgi:membrane protease YdiL (CAAX protease family)|nr:CPBP family intramembrane glutamic endopeptidase [Candidatus Sulfotelmatobacter sp.]